MPVSVLSSPRRVFPTNRHHAVLPRPPDAGAGRVAEDGALLAMAGVVMASHRPAMAVAPPDDLAFADTMVVSDLGLEEPPPPSGIVVSDARGATHHLVPVPFPVPVHARRPVPATLEDVRALWQATSDRHVAPRGLALVADWFRRVTALLFSFEWDRADLLRAAWIAVAVFVLVATVGATFVRLGAP
jgi:hypothetical protein